MVKQPKNKITIIIDKDNVDGEGKRFIIDHDFATMSGLIRALNETLIYATEMAREEIKRQ